VSRREVLPAGRSAPVAGAVVVVGVLLVALNLRGPLVAPSAVIGPIQADLGITSAVAGLLTSLPVLCFAVATLPASWLIGRIGLERAVLVALVLLTAGTLVRPAADVTAAMIGTVLIGVGITIGNVAVPVVIGRDFPRRSSAMLGAYTAALNIGSMITLSLTVPVAGAVGWRWALAAWVSLVLLAVVGWSVAARGRASGTTDDGAHADAGTEGAVDPPKWWRRGVVWGLIAAFGGQSFAYYGLTAWLPEILTSLRGLDAAGAGAAASIFQIAAVIGAIGVPVLRARTNSLRTSFVVVAVCWLALPLGLLLLPGGWPMWCALGGAAQGGGFTVLVAAVLARAHGVTDSRRISAAMQGGGYALGAAGPTVVGAVHESTLGWTVPLVLVAVALALLAASGLASTGGARTAPAQ